MLHRILLIVAILATGPVGCASTAETSASGDGSTASVITLQHAEAASVASTVRELLSAGTTARVEADQRSNALLVSGTPADVERVRTLVAQLDRPR